MQVTAAMKTAKFVPALNPPMVLVAIMLKPSIGADTHPYHFALESAFPGQCL